MTSLERILKENKFNLLILYQMLYFKNEKYSFSQIKSNEFFVTSKSSLKN